MPRFVHGRRNQVVGFSLFELLVVVAIALLVTAIGLPLMNNVIANMKLRASMTSVSGLLQNTRMAAVKQNKIMTAKYTNLTSPPYSLIYYSKVATDSTPLASPDPQVEMEAIEYFKDNRIGGSGGWAAISITPAGRIKRWFWSGSAWMD